MIEKTIKERYVNLMVKVVKNKYIQICLSFLVLAALIFSTTLVYFLGWVFEMRTFWIYLAATAAEVIVVTILCVGLIKSNKCYYLITPESVKMFKKEQELFTISNANIIKINYVGFAWALLMQMGAGFLHLEYTDETEQIKPTISLPNGQKIYSISMSPKQAKQVAKILNKNLQHK